MKIIQDALVWLYIIAIANILGATVYQMFVIVPEFTRGFPNGMIDLSTSNVIPGNFWGSPIILLSTLVIPLLAIPFNWKTPRRKWLLLAFCFGMVASVSTTIYFIPRLAIMGLLDQPVTTDIALLRRTVDEWIIGDHLRFWLLVIPCFATLIKAASVRSVEIKSKHVKAMPNKVAVAVY
jgi:hypothetical protein